MRISTASQRSAIPQHPVTAPRLAKTLTFSGIRFGYHPEQLILHNLHLTIKAARQCDRRTPTGAARVLLLNLIPRFYDPQSGSIEIDGVDLRKMRPSRSAAADQCCHARRDAF